MTAKHACVKQERTKQVWIPETKQSKQMCLFDVRTLADR